MPSTNPMLVRDLQRQVGMLAAIIKTCILDEPEGRVISAADLMSVRKIDLSIQELPDGLRLTLSSPPGMDNRNNNNITNIT